MQVTEQFHRGGVVLPSHIKEFALMWTPVVGEPVEIPLNEPIDWANGQGPGTFTLLTRRSFVSAKEAGRIAEAVREATENPGRMVVVDDDAWKGFPLDGDEVQR